MMLTSVGFANLQASVRIETMFASDSRLIRDYEWIERHVGPQGAIDIVVRLDDAGGASASEQLEILDRVKTLMLQQPEILSVTSCLDVAPGSVKLVGGDHVIDTFRSLRNLRATQAISDRLRVTNAGV